MTSFSRTTTRAPGMELVLVAAPRTRGLAVGPFPFHAIPRRAMGQGVICGAQKELEGKLTDDCVPDEEKNAGRPQDVVVNGSSSQTRPLALNGADTAQFAQDKIADPDQKDPLSDVDDCEAGDPFFDWLRTLTPAQVATLKETCRLQESFRAIQLEGVPWTGTAEENIKRYRAIMKI